MLVKTYCAAVNGLEVTTVTIEVSITRGVLFHLTGLGDETVRESRDRIAAALMNNGYRFPVAGPWPSDCWQAMAICRTACCKTICS